MDKLNIQPGDKVKITGLSKIVQVWESLDERGKEIFLHDLGNMDASMWGGAGIAALLAIATDGLTWVYDDKGEIQVKVSWDENSKPIIDKTIMKNPVDKTGNQS